MTERKIMLEPGEAAEFVRNANHCDFDIDIFYNRYSVDAKSILGVMALDFSKVLTVRYYGYNADFENYLNHFAIAGSRM